MSIEGGCFCRSVRYRITMSPTGSMICHCETCRRIAGAPTVAWISVPMQSFEILQGRLTELASSPPVRRGFCPLCGTHVLYGHSKDPESLDVTTCSLDDPNAFPPTHHSWLSDDLKWVKFGDGLPAFPRFRD
jgi:hypothetical protein